MIGQRDISIRSACKAAHSFIGTPYRHQGRAPGAGLDCIGLVVASLEAAGIDISGLPSDYSHIPKPKLILSNIARYCDVVAEMAPGDILVMALRTHPQHLALYVGDNQIIHSYMAAGKVVKHDLTDNYKNKIHSIYRMKDGLFI